MNMNHQQKTAKRPGKNSPPKLSRAKNSETQNVLKISPFVRLLRVNFCLAPFLYPRHYFTSIGPLGLPSGLRPEIGGKRPKNGLQPHRGNGQKNGRKMGKIARKWLKNGIFGPFLPFFGHSSVRFPGEAVSHFFGLFSPISGRRPEGSL